MLEYLRTRPATAAVLLAAAVAVVALAAFHQPSPPDLTVTREFEPQEFAVIAYRGASAYAPEHTLASYAKALGMGADYIEVDLQMTQDGALIALHDVSLERTTDAEEVYPDREPWIAGLFTLEEIKRLDAGSWFGEEYAGEEVPTLQEVIDLVGRDARLYIETKEPEAHPGMERRLIEVLDENGLLGTDRVIVQSFSPESLQLLRELDEDLFLVQLYSPEMVAGQDREELLDAAAEYANGIGPDKDLVDAGLVQEANRRNLVVHPYTVNERADMLRLLNLGVEGMFTDMPDHLMGILQRSG
ncbi:glycerophosphodiester phosphodiesterase [Rubrobacter taiwanensis]|uniref:Glycerophosphodiester phosphodiesterase n=1 Tax=Rubrobacter taiwanensis TaxID=185139 RepID=A0A4R1BGY3_9ACTN|nr:glycerophosphodiester phosphodiesterase [Rubrobacter taiwanensis]TCJ16469.1 glycerophosphodiester phosphodiesterase [Rubrobacter taiwanensis]